jgi:hypothetical protein
MSTQLENKTGKTFTIFKFWYVIGRIHALGKVVEIFLDFLSVATWECSILGMQLGGWILMRFLTK